jgi:DNA-binding NtrC family response regulator
MTATIRDMATRTLSRFGYSVETACNGEEALSLYAGRQDRFDLVILDLGMPGMGGHKCLQEMLRINPLAKILIASGYSLNDRIMGAMKPKVAGFLAKPYEIRSLLEKVRSVLDSDEDRAGGAVTPRPSEEQPDPKDRLATVFVHSGHGQDVFVGFHHPAFAVTTTFSPNGR